MVQNWPRTLSWGNFTSVPNPGPGQFVALNGLPIVARVALSIMFYPDASNIVQEGAVWRFSNCVIALVTNGLSYVPSRIPQGRENHYLAHEQGHLDLMGLFARELEVNLLALRGTSRDNLRSQANTTTDAAVTNARMYAINVPGTDCLYDVETRHGMSDRDQRRWLRLIAANMARRTESDFLFRT